MRSVLIIGLILALAGCANPQARKDFAQQLNNGDVPAATASALASSSLKDDRPTELLWGLEAGTMLRYTNQTKRSNSIFDGAEALMKDDDTRNVASSTANQALSLVANDNVMPYSPTQYDGVMVNTYKALNYWQQGDFADARVEWNRSDDRQRRATEYFAKEISEQRDAIAKGGNSELTERSLSGSQDALKKAGVDLNTWKPYEGYVNPAATYLYGLFFMLNGEGASDLDKARESFKRVYALTQNAQVKIDLAAVRGKKAAHLQPKVWVLFENGMAAHKEELRIDLPLFLVSGSVKYTGMALPIMKDGTQAYPYLSVGRQQTQLLADMDQIVRGEYKTQFKAILIKEIVRTIAKTVAQAEVNKSSPLAGSLMAIAQAVSTQADLRGWSTLPKNFQLLAVPYPESSKLVLSIPGHADMTVDLPQEKKSVVVYVRALNPMAGLSVQVLPTI